MARYRRYDVRISLDSKVRMLSQCPPCGEFLWYYILSLPESTMIPGLCRVGRAAIAEARGWSVESFDAAFMELSEQGLAKADWSSRVLWIPNVIEYDPPANPNVILGWKPHWDEIPECRLKREAWERFERFFGQSAKSRRPAAVKEDGATDAWLAAFVKSCSKPQPKSTRRITPNPSPYSSGKHLTETSGDSPSEEGIDSSGKLCAPSRDRSSGVPDTGEQEQEEKKRPGGRPRAGKFDMASVEIPEGLRRPRFEEAWAARIVERGEPGAKGGRPSRSQVECQLASLGEVATINGIDYAIACVRRAIEGRHQGIVFPQDRSLQRNANGPRRDDGVPPGYHPDGAASADVLQRMMSPDVAVKAAAQQEYDTANPRLPGFDPSGSLR